MTKITKKIISQPYPNSSLNENESIKTALMQKAVGFQTSEIVEEYNYEDEKGKLTLNKKKVLTKQYPPDLDAVQKLIELNGLNQIDVSSMADFELEQEKQRLLALLKNGEETK